MYLGTFGHQLVAVKKKREGGLDREFLSEIRVLGKVWHINIVPLIGCCEEQSCLIYPYMPGGNLREALDRELPAAYRIQVAADVSCGLRYLHNLGQGSSPIMHRDLKSRNVLLDENMNARIADFGFARPLQRRHSSSNSVLGAVGTQGYMDPESVATGTLTLASDVYSFGVIMFELVTGLQAFDSACEVPNLSARMRSWLLPQVNSGRFAPLQVDPSANWDGFQNEAWQLVSIAWETTSFESATRPTILQASHRKCSCEILPRSMT